MAANLPGASRGSYVVPPTSESGSITYRYLESGDVAVYLDARRADIIIPIKGGYAYVPAGQKRSQHGDVFPSIDRTLDSLREEG